MNAEDVETIEVRIDASLDVVLERAVAAVVRLAEKQGITLTENELELIEMGASAGSAMNMEYVHERGWLNAAKMTRDLLVDP